MSYEGFVERLCANGHLRTHDCYDYEQADKTACSCGASWAFEHHVDETNGIFEHHVDETNGIVVDDPSTQRYPFEVATEAPYEVCNLGHKHYTGERTYKIPTGAHNDESK